MERSADDGVKLTPIWYATCTGVIVIALLVGLGVLIFPKSAEGIFVNLYTEVISISAAILILNRITKNREDRIVRNQLIRELVASEGIAIRALQELRANEWLVNGDLISVYIGRAKLAHGNLEDAVMNSVNMVDADLQEAKCNYIILTDADLGGANLMGAYLWEAQLNRTNLYAAKLDESKLQKANLDDAYLNYASLRNANLEGASLNRTKLENADLTGAKLRGATVLGGVYSGCVLPDGKVADKDFVDWSVYTG